MKRREKKELLEEQKEKQYYDPQIAKGMTDALSIGCKISCRLMDMSGETVFEQPSGLDGCALCQKYLGHSGNCDRLHLNGAEQAERFGGRYIYFCTAGMAWCAAPVLSDGTLRASLVGGPVLMMEPDDFLAGMPQFHTMSAQDQRDLTEQVNGVSSKLPAEVGHISNLFLSAAHYIGNSSTVLLHSGKQQLQQQDIGEQLQSLKSSGAAARYPLETEREMLHAITNGEIDEARRLLNLLLGHILFATGGDFSRMRARSLELMTLLSRAAADGGGDLEELLYSNQRFLKENDNLNSVQDLIGWLNRVLENYSALVFALPDVQYRNTICKALNYIRQHCADNLTMTDVAEHVGFSPSYFSKLFKTEMGVTFSGFLNGMRVEQSKAMLRDNQLSMNEICERLGFEEQSYFIKVFRRHTGMTPGKYRKSLGKPDTSTERDTGA